MDFPQGKKKTNAFLSAFIKFNPVYFCSCFFSKSVFSIKKVLYRGRNPEPDPPNRETWSRTRLEAERWLDERGAPARTRTRSGPGASARTRTRSGHGAPEPRLSLV